MQKLLLALIFVIGSMGYIVVQRGIDEQSTPPVGTAIQTSSAAIPVNQADAQTHTTTTNTTSSGGTPTQTPLGTQTPTPVKTKGAYSDGTFTGSAATQPYGTVQVAVVISGGRITNVKLLQTPHGGGETQYINQQALPLLVEETLSAQSGNIDGVSGASLTSPAFIQSLQSALSKAKA